jgi:hypothetical protein
MVGNLFDHDLPIPADDWPVWLRQPPRAWPGWHAAAYRLALGAWSRWLCAHRSTAPRIRPAVHGSLGDGCTQFRMPGQFGHQTTV